MPFVQYTINTGHCSIFFSRNDLRKLKNITTIPPYSTPDKSGSVVRFLKVCLYLFTEIPGLGKGSPTNGSLILQDPVQRGFTSQLFRRIVFL